MPELKNKTELAAAAKSLAKSFELIQRGSATFIPVDWQTLMPKPVPPPTERIWQPLEAEDMKMLANQESNILFATDAEFRSFTFMLKQLSHSNDSKVTDILVRTRQGLRLLTEDGELVNHTGEFTPNYVKPMLNEDPSAKAYVFNVIKEWVGGDEAEAHSLLSHLATSLAPGWSAVKYVILLGEGRNGKGTLLLMLTSLFGDENISGVSRQAMAEKSSTCVALNNKLLNVIFDGEMAYIKDSSMEKTLVAGEPGYVRQLYESGMTRVQTNALFIEALNKEPKARDKSSALQKRLVRFNFPNIYAKDIAFEQQMTSEPMLGALLALLIDHYVKPDELAAKLAPTQGSMSLQMEQVWLGSPLLQFLEHLSSKDPSFITKLEAKEVTVDTFTGSFKPWLEQQGLRDRSDGDILEMLKTAFDIGWKTTRVNKKPTNRRTITGIKPETLQALEQMKGDGDATADAVQELVGD